MMQKGIKEKLKLLTVKNSGGGGGIEQQMMSKNGERKPSLTGNSIWPGKAEPAGVEME